MNRLRSGAAGICEPLTLAHLENDTPPLLAVVVDTEEEFDWEQSFNRRDHDVKAVEHLPMAQRVSEKFGIVPTYVVDYPIGEDAKAVSILRAWKQSGRAAIGAHLHPWVNPPFEETEEPANTYPGNLPFLLEYRKLEALTNLIAARFGERPIVYKAGRCGLGPATAKILESLGYEIDASVLPFTNLRFRGGPDFSGLSNAPFWFGDKRDLFAIPLTRGLVGPLRSLGTSSFSLMDHPLPRQLGVIGVLARLGLLERITLTPEAMSLDDQKRLTQALLKQGCKVFTYTYHSSSLLPGATQYVRSPAERDAFLEKMDRYFDYFKREVGGRFASLTEIRDCHRRVPESDLRQSEPRAAMTGNIVKAAQ